MARRLDKQKALVMREKGMSYAQIKEKLKVSKSTLSNWLYDIPLSEDKIKLLRDNSTIRIEKYRNTMKLKRELRLEEVYKKAAKDIGSFSEREIFLLGLFLYWGEGTKAQKYSVALTNTNPAMLKFFIQWLELLNVQRKDLKIKLHLYSDMDIAEGIEFWSKELNIMPSQFRKPYIKNTNLKSITYKNGFGKGTCCVMFDNRNLWEYIMMGLKYVSSNNQ
jgi:transcriptional regulator with XRE-family HTH domain